MNHLGYHAGAADGVFGDNTSSALKKFQGDNQLTVDGVCGQKTWNALDRLLASPTEPEETEKTEAKLTPEQAAIIRLAQQCKAAGLDVDIPSF